MNEQPVPDGARWQPPAWHPEHPSGARSVTAEMPAAAPAQPSAAAAPAQPRRTLPPRLRKRAAVGAAAAALLAIGGVGGFAVGSATAGDDAVTTSVVQPGTTPDGTTGTLPGGGQGPGAGGFPGAPPGTDGTTDDGTI